MTDKEISDQLRSLVDSTESAVVRAAAASLALQICPWPTADKTELARWRHSSRLAKAIDAAIKSALALAQIGFIPGAEWFIKQALSRSQLVDYLDERLVSRLLAAKQQVNSLALVLGSPLRATTETKHELLQSAIRRADAVACLRAVADMTSCEFSPDQLMWGLLPQLVFLKSLRDLQRQLDQFPTNLEKLRFLEKTGGEVEAHVPQFPCNMVLIVQDHENNVWGVTRQRRTVLTTRFRLEELDMELASILKQNKENVRTASQQHVQAFWRERRTVEAEIADILRRANNEMDDEIGSLLSEINNPEIVLGLPSWLSNFPFEALACFKNRQVVRAVPLAGQSRLPAGTGGGFAVVNPGGDLRSTESVVSGVLKKFHTTVGRPMEESTFVHKLETEPNFVYAGHCGGERFFNGSAIQRTRVISDVHLFGCRSAEIQRSFSTPWHYLIGGSPSVTAVLWDVLGRDCDRVTKTFLQSVISEDLDVGAALYKAKQSAKFPCLTAAAFVIYQPIRQVGSV